MKIFVDADACPVVCIVEEIAEKCRIDVVLLCDTNHILVSDYSEGIIGRNCQLLSQEESTFAETVG